MLRDNLNLLRFRVLTVVAPASLVGLAGCTSGPKTRLPSGDPSDQLNVEAGSSDVDASLSQSSASASSPETVFPGFSQQPAGTAQDGPCGAPRRTPADPDWSDPALGELLVTHMERYLSPEQVADRCGEECVAGYEYYEYCFDWPSDTCEDPRSGARAAALYSCGLAQGGWISCGPYAMSDNDAGTRTGCCFIVTGDCPIGRPLLVAGEASLATLTEHSTPNGDWIASLNPAVAVLDQQTRAVLADVWSRDGLSEHASVGAFARFILDCLRVGAPAYIVAEAQSALRDEMRHAQLCFGLASAYAGTPTQPGELAALGALEDRKFEEIVLDAVREGCIAETVSAMILAEARDLARDDTVRQVLSEIVSDELRHVELAWRFVLWAWGASSGKLRAQILALFDRAEHYVGFGIQPNAAADAEQLTQHGSIPVELRRQVAIETIAHVIRPAASVLAFRT